MQAMEDDLYSIGPFDNDDEVDFPELDGPVFLLGRALVEAVWSAYFDIGSRDLVLFSVLVLIFLFRPGGLLGFSHPSPRQV